MDDKRRSSEKYRTKARLLARKGAAEPLLRNEARLELVTDGRSDRSGEGRPVGTAGRVASRNAAAALTVLLDESLVDIVSPVSGRMKRPLSAKALSRRDRRDR